MDDVALAILRRHEGKRNDVYRDHLGYWTIGYGHLISRDKTMTEEEAREAVQGPWTDVQCEHMLGVDYFERCRALRNLEPWVDELPEWPQRGLFNMAFQMGVAGVQGFPRMLAALKKRDWPAARVQALSSKWAQEQTPQRAREVATMIGNEAIA